MIKTEIDTLPPAAVKIEKHRALRLAGKICAWIIGSIIALIILLMCAVAWFLTPERLTPLVEKYASEYLKADVKASRIELTVWKSFPYIYVEVDSLRLTSRSLQAQPDSVLRALPADASRLLEADKIQAGVNPWHLLHGLLKLSDINISGLGVNLVAYSPEITNYDILPPSEEKEEEESQMRIALSNVQVQATRSIRYFDASSGIDVLLSRPMLNVAHQDDVLLINFTTTANLALDSHEYLRNMPINMQGDVKWNQQPMAFSSDNLSLSSWGMNLAICFGLDLDKNPALTRFNVEMPPVEIMPLLRQVLPELIDTTPELKQLDTNAALGFSAHTVQPWLFSSPNLPDVQVEYTIPSSRLTYGSGADALNLSDLHLNGTFTYNGTNPESSTASVPVLAMRGEGVDLSLTLQADEALSADPLLTLTSRGNADISRFASFIPIPGTMLKGTLEANASVRCRLSDIIETRWQNIDANGSVQVRGLLLSIPVLTTRLFAGMATLTFGNNIAHADTRLVAGMLRAKADVDTLYCEVPGISVGVRDISLDAGTTSAMLAAHNPKDVMPMGMRLNASRLVMNSSVDTLHLVARSLQADGRITRYQGGAQSPLLQADISASRLRYTDPYTRLGVRDFSADMQAHLRPRNNSGVSPYQRRYDAIAKANPTLSADSVAKLASAPRMPQNAVIDMSVDNGLKALIRQWGVQGGVRADRVNLTYIAYPVKTRLTNLALDFSLDSLRLHRAYLVSQGNRLSVSGTVANLRQAMLGRVRRPLIVRLNADIDSLDINQIAYNFELGKGLMAKRGHLARINPEDEDALVRAAAELAPADTVPIDTTMLIVPRNIDARIFLTARQAQYTNLSFHDLRGNLIMNDGAVSIDSLTMATDFGTAYLNLLYSSRDPQDLNMSLDLGFSHVNLADFYTSFPTIVEMMPVITNLNGMVEASLTGSFNLYPNMDIDLNSINAMLNINGTNLSLTQDDMIRKVAHMMLIRKKGALSISDMNIQVSLHDNVMRLYPFAFSMEKYKFALLGENDLDQNMYYHLSVLRSPIPWRFGINIKGTFDKPKFRFGGPKYKENQAREVVNLVKAERVNFVRAMRMQLHKLVGRAALDYASRHEPNEDAELQDQSMTDTPYDNPADMLGNMMSSPISRILGANANLLEQVVKTKDKDKK